MKFVPKPLIETADASADPRARRYEIWKLLLFAAVLLFVVIAGGGWLIDRAVVLIPPRFEAKWFRDFPIDGLVPDDRLAPALRGRHAAARETLQELAKQPGVPPLEYRLGVMEQNSPNAFAVPGGRVVVTTGLLRQVEPGIPMAFVLAHELGHFAGRDHLRTMGRALLGELVFSVIGMESGGSATRATARLIRSRFSRDQESVADAFGLRLVRGVYGTTEGADQLFEAIAGNGGLPGWLHVTGTHPDTPSRIRALRRLDEQLAEEARRQHPPAVPILPPVSGQGSPAK